MYNRCIYTYFSFRDPFWNSEASFVRNGGSYAAGGKSYLCCRDILRIPQPKDPKSGDLREDSILQMPFGTQTGRSNPGFYDFRSSFLTPSHGFMITSEGNKNTEKCCEDFLVSRNLGSIYL